MAIKYTLQIKQNLQAKPVLPNAFALSPGQCSLCDTGCSTEPSLQLMLHCSAEQINSSSSLFLSWVWVHSQRSFLLFSSCYRAFTNSFCRRLSEPWPAHPSLSQGLPLSYFLELSSGEESSKAHSGEGGQGQSDTSFAPFSTAYIFSSIISSFQAGH